MHRFSFYLTATLLSLVPPVVNRSHDEETCSVDHKALGDKFHMKYGLQRVLKQELCFAESPCLQLVDAVDDKNDFERAIASERFIISSVYLKVPEGTCSDSEEDLDTSKWKVDKSRLVFSSYTTTMIEEMFLSGAVPIKKDAEAQVLMLGLGGGMMNSYLHHMYPKMNITVVEIDQKMYEVAVKWFDLEEDNRQRVIIMDGVTFLKNALKEDLQYDVIHVDVCSIRPEITSFCPSAAFYSLDVVRILSKLTSKKGVVIINVLASESITARAMKLKFLYESEFSECRREFSIYGQANMVVTCSHSDRPEGLEMKYRKFAKYPQKFLSGT